MNRTEKVIMNREMNSIMIKMISEFTKQTQDNKTFWTFIDKSANGTLIFETYILGYYYQISQYRSGFSEKSYTCYRFSFIHYSKRDQNQPIEYEVVSDNESSNAAKVGLYNLMKELFSVITQQFTTIPDDFKNGVKNVLGENYEFKEELR
ncbi:MAG: hypothetical protein IKA36_02550 [Clostridia bacterium]|nr:hypothetical protein [Clostridia bacterium]